LLPEKLLRYSIRDSTLVPHYLDERDHPWLSALLEEYRSFQDRPRRLLEERLREPLPCSSPQGKRLMAIHVLDRLCRDRSRSDVPPRQARAAVFTEAAKGRGDRQAVLETAARRAGVAPLAMEESLFADLPPERSVTPPPETLSPGELALRTNLVLAQGLLFRAAKVELSAFGNARAVVRHAKLRGLLCTVRPPAHAVAAASITQETRTSGIGEEARREDAQLVLSGPYSLFRKTLVYGRALGEIVPLLSWCTRFRLRAECLLRGSEPTPVRPTLLCLQSGDPIFPSREPRLYDSLVEERFARAMRRLTNSWDVVREPEPIEAGGTLIFPDFGLQNRLDPRRRWLIEIVGFWTPGYLEAKLARLRSARRSDLILCIDLERNCAEADLPPGSPVFLFKRTVDAAALLAFVEKASHSSA